MAQQALARPVLAEMPSPHHLTSLPPALPPSQPAEMWRLHCAVGPAIDEGDMNFPPWLARAFG